MVILVLASLSFIHTGHTHTFPYAQLHVIYLVLSVTLVHPTYSYFVHKSSFQPII